MKRLASLFILVAGTMSSLAVVSVNWSSPGNSIKGPDGTTNAPSTWIAQLIYSPDNVISPLDSNDPFLPTEGEIVMGSRALNINNIAGRIFSASPKVSGADGLAGGFVYTRVFNVDFGSSTAPTLFGNGAVIGGPLVVETSTPSTVLAHWASPTGTQLTVNQAIVAVPEPSTYAFFGVGALVLARRLRKR